MPHFVEGLVAGPWVLALVVVIAGLDAILPFMPSETTVVTVGLIAAGTGEPNLLLLIVAAAAGAFAGDLLAYRAGQVAYRLRAKPVPDWVHRLLRSRGAVIIVFARYVPGGRSATAYAAGLVHYHASRFRWFTALGVVVWATQAALLGYLGGSLFEDRPLLGLLSSFAGALAISGLAITISQVRQSQAARRP